MIFIRLDSEPTQHNALKQLTPIIHLPKQSLNLGSKFCLPMIHAIFRKPKLSPWNDSCVLTHYELHLIVSKFFAALRITNISYIFYSTYFWNRHLILIRFYLFIVAGLASAKIKNISKGPNYLCFLIKLFDRFFIDYTKMVFNFFQNLRNYKNFPLIKII